MAGAVELDDGTIDHRVREVRVCTNHSFASSGITFFAFDEQMEVVCGCISKSQNCELVERKNPLFHFDLHQDNCAYRRAISKENTKGTDEVAHMTRRGLYFAVLRVSVIVLWCAGLLALGRGFWLLAGIAAASAVAVYTFWPRQIVPQETMTYNRFSAIIGPDWLGILFGGVMIVLPFWAASDLTGDGWVHPMAWGLWPMAALCLSFTAIGWRHEAFILTIGEDGLSIDTGTQHLAIAWDSIDDVRPWRRDLPAWMRSLAPLLATSGHFLQAGAIMVARESRGMVIRQAGRKPVVIGIDAFEANAKRLMSEFLKRGIKIGRGLSHVTPRHRHESKKGDLVG